MSKTFGKGNVEKVSIIWSRHSSLILESKRYPHQIQFLFLKNGTPEILQYQNTIRSSSLIGGGGGENGNEETWDVGKKINGMRLATLFDFLFSKNKVAWCHVIVTSTTLHKIGEKI